MARTFPSVGQSPIDGYASGAPDRPLAHFQWDLSGTGNPTADAVVKIDLNDAMTGANYTLRGLHVDYDGEGDKTTATIVGVGIDLAVGGDTPYCYALKIHSSAVSNHTMEMLMGMDVYMEDAGTAVQRWYAFNVGMVSTSTPAGETGFMRFRNHGATSLNCIFRIESNNPATYLLNLQGASMPYHSANRSVSDGSIQIIVNGIAKWLQCYAS